MKKNIFLGAIPLQLGRASTITDNAYAPQDFTHSPAPQYTFERQDVVVEEVPKSGEPTPPVNVAEDKPSDGTGEKVESGNVENAETKSAISVPVIIGAAALIYFFFLRKKN